MKTHPITIHEQSNSCVFKPPFNFRNFLAEILSTEKYTLDIHCSEEMLDNEEFEVQLKLEDLGILVVEMLYGRDSRCFECSIGEDYHNVVDAASFWRWVAICGRKTTNQALTTPNS